MTRTILMPLDLSERADRILAHLRSVVTRDDADVVLLHVLPEAATESEAWDAWRGLQQRQSELSGRGAHVRSELRVGDPVDGILGLVGALHPTMVAMSTHGRTGLSRAVRGSVAERVLRHSAYPVYLYHSGRPEMLPGAWAPKILVPLDGSEASERILPLAAEFARLRGGEIVLFNVWTPTPALPLAEIPAQVLFSTVRAQTEKQLSSVQDRLKAEGASVRVRVEMGMPAEAILDAAADERAELIAMTTHGRTGLARFVFGSVAEAVLRRCTCAALVLRTGERSVAEAPLHAAAGGA